MFQTILFIGFPEIVTVLVIAVMLFGADKLPEIARTFGKTVRQVRNASDDIKREIMNPIEDIKTEVKEETENISPLKDIQKEIEEIKDMNNLNGPVKRKF